jgi:hypothetical protein
MSQPKWITFTPAPTEKERRTLRWRVRSIEGFGGQVIGHIEWYARWRCYAFFPAAETVFEKTCLRDLADFCEQATRDRAAARRGEIEASHG